MATIDSYPVLDFSGGIRRDVGPSELRRNEVLDARNLHLDEKGRVITRLGSQQLGNTLSGTIENSFFFSTVDSGVGSTLYGSLIVNDLNISSTGFNILQGKALTADVAVGDTTISVTSTGTLAASGNVEIEGDLISYTGNTGTSLTGVSGISSSHLSGAPIHQWVTLSLPSQVDARSGVSYAVLNDILYFQGLGHGMKSMTFPLGVATVADVSGEPSCYLLANYRDRLYTTGDGPNVTPKRILFSARGNGGSWTTTSDFFEVEDQTGEFVRGLKVFSDTLGIFKDSRIYTYNEIELKQRIPDVGAYSHKVIQEVDGKLYTFCPTGIFVTNLFSAKSIGEPVKEFFRNFTPIYDTDYYRLCTNAHAWVYDHSYFLYISDITVPTVTNDVVLEYDTRREAWTVHDGGFTNFVHVNNFAVGRFGVQPTVSSYAILTHRPILIGGDSSGKVWRLNENRFLSLSQVVVGGDVFVDRRSNTGSPISSVLELQMYDLTHPELFKQFKDLRVLTESGQWNIEYRIEDEKGISPYRPLGSVSTTNVVLAFPSEAQGWSCGLRITGISSNAQRTLNGVIFENTGVIKRR